MENKRKPWYKKYWWLIVGVLILFWCVGKFSPKNTPPRDYVAEANQLFEKIQNPTTTEELNADIQSAENLYAEMSQLKDSSDNFLIAQMNLESVVKLKEQTLKNAEQRIKIKKLQDEWNGGFSAINKSIKKQMHDPASFEHVNTEYIVKNGNIIISTEYRGKNIFGAKVLGSVSGIMDMEGNILELKLSE